LQVKNSIVLEKKMAKTNRVITMPAATKATKIKSIDCNSTLGFKGDKTAAQALLTTLNAEMAELQNTLYAEHKHKILIVLQAMDTGGKDGVIRKVFSGINPQGVKIVSFKAPTSVELDHDFLWRIHAAVPAKGDIAVFNRSHYEDVLITRVHKWIDDKTAAKRMRQINDFERTLAEEGTTILKFFLHISKSEQKIRLQSRLDDPTRSWKFNPTDLEERKYWDDYQIAFQDAISRTSTAHAPWYVVPANRKWVRDLAISTVIVEKLRSLKLKYPEPAENLDAVEIED
jgi:PPK2 family polyphosphate:nucleotide phosphotransferase